MKIQAEEKQMKLTAADVATELEAQIQCRLGGRLRDFLLVVTDEGVILRGHANTYHGKQLAQHAVMEATLLPILANEIEVSRGLSTHVSLY
jgi:hypothetical protein